MKVLQVNCVYNKGSTGKIVYDIHTELISKGQESIVCYGRGKKTKEPNVYKVCSELYAKFNNLLSRFTGLMYGGCYFSTLNLIRIIKKEKPDVVHLHCLNGYFVNIYRLITWLKKSNIKTVLTLHAEFMHTANCSHAYDCEKWKSGCGNCPRCKKETKSILFDRTHVSWRKMKAAFDGFENLTVVSVSPWLMDRAKQSPILADKEHLVVLNGLSTEIFKNYDNTDLRNLHNIKGEKIIFHATPTFNNDKENIKGGYYVIELAKRMLNDNVKFIIAGKHPDDIIVPENMILLGNISSPEKLAGYYSLADVTVLTSKRETFSMICAESLCCGTPVVGFEAGAPEQISIPEYSTFVKYGDIDLLYSSVKETLKRNIVVPEDRSYSWYDKRNMINQYISEYEKVLSK